MSVIYCFYKLLLKIPCQNLRNFIGSVFQLSNNNKMADSLFFFKKPPPPQHTHRHHRLPLIKLLMSIFVNCPFKYSNSIQGLNIISSFFSVSGNQEASRWTHTKLWETKAKNHFYRVSSFDTSIGALRLMYFFWKVLFCLKHRSKFD